MGGPAEMPASMVGGMALGELVIHGWDLTQATGQSPVWPAELLAYLREEVAKAADQGRTYGVYGPEVQIPADSPPLHHVLALTGRNPSWTPPGR